MGEALLIQNPLLKTYCAHASILILKTLAMSILTALQRFRYKSYVNGEDANFFKVKPVGDDKIERIRSAHLNDLESIPFFLIISLIYVFTDPSVCFASVLFLIFTIARFSHTIIYVILIPPQPARAISFGIGLLTTAYMSVASILHFSG